MIDIERLEELEIHLEPWKVPSPSSAIRVLGYGEISTVFAIGEDTDVAYKRMPLFSSQARAEGYAESYRRYTGLLREAGLELPEDETAVIHVPGRPTVLYVAQRQLPPERFCNVLVKGLGQEASRELLASVAERIARVWSYNERNRPETELSIDGQISNWVLLQNGQLLFVDTRTPMFRVGGVEQLDPELFLSSAPSFLRWLLRLAFLDEVMSRYYSRRRVFMDLVANLHKEQRADLVPAALEAVNARLSGEEPLTATEVEKYYAGDKVIWSVFLAFRRFDRWVKTRIAGRRYEFVLPGRIAR
jgi:hypothetical protein